ncbi:MAG: hypothetical protein HC859_01710 [Bacteroidia bacterium]|nr:hypothetical protein [Bacteroidia bacterium]
MKKILKHWAYGSVHPVNFPAFRSLASGIQESVQFKSAGYTRDVSLAHCIVSQTPFKVAIYFRDGWDAAMRGDEELLISRGKKNWRPQY